MKGFTSRTVAIACLAALLPLGCARLPAPTAPLEPASEIADLAAINQDPVAHIDPGTAERWLMTAPAQAVHWKKYLERFFSPWSRTRPAHSASEAGWGFTAYEKKTGYGENLKIRQAAWFEDLRRIADLGGYPNTSRRAVAIRRTDLRVLPTDKPFFLDPSLPGEGYPFDYMQNSGVFIGTPLFIAHTSACGAWVLAETSYASGWVHVDDIAWVDDTFITEYWSDRFVTPIRDRVPLLDEVGTYRGTGRIGMVLPLDRSDRVIVPASDAYRRAVALPVAMDPAHLAPAPLAPTSANFARLASHLMGEPYGWGDYLGNRDCSAMIRDLYAPFGIWLPRNSAQQAKAGRGYPLADLSAGDKEAWLRSEATPWLTIVYMRGHVLLYIGQAGNGRPLVLHDVWGLKTDDPGSKNGIGRRVIGGVVITTLTPGAELPDLKRPEGLLIERVESAVLLERNG